MNLVDTTTGRRDVTVGRPPAQGEPRAVTALNEGDVIAVPFAGYGDILCAIESIDDRGDDVVIVGASDGEFTYNHEMLRSAAVLVYPTSMKGKVRS